MTVASDPVSSEDTENRADKPQRHNYTRPAIVAVVLVAVYLLLRWLPVEAGVETTGSQIDALLLWCTGGIVTLAFLVIAARKS
ncbi:MAG: hypothetical protein ACK5ME_00195 [Parahaliea sp.]